MSVVIFFGIIFLAAISIVGFVFIVNAFTFSNTMPVNSEWVKDAVKTEADAVHEQYMEQRKIIPLKKLPSPEETIYDYVMSYVGPVNEATNKNIMTHGYTIKMNGENVYLLVNFGATMTNYIIHFDFAHDFKFESEKITMMYHHLAHVKKKHEIDKKQQEHKLAMDKDAAKRNAMLGTTTVYR